MKKFLVLAIAVMCFASGCTKKYDSVEEYAKDMKAVQQAQKSYALEFEKLSYQDQQNQPYKQHFKVYKKNNLWKYVDLSEKRDLFYNILYDGKDRISYGNGKWAMLIPSDIKDKELHQRMEMSPVAADELFYWYKPGKLFVKSEDKPKFVNSNEKMNGIDCRLIKYSDNYEVCVSDKLGLAVYVKTKAYNSYISKTIETTTNIIKVDTTELSDSIFVLPNDKQIYSEDKILKEMSKGNF